MFVLKVIYELTLYWRFVDAVIPRTIGPFGRTPLTGEPSQATSPGWMALVWSGKGCLRDACFLSFCSSKFGLDCFWRLGRFGSTHGSGATLYINNSLTLQT